MHKRNADLIARISHRYNEGGVIQHVLQFEARFNETKNSVKIFCEDLAGDIMARFNSKRCQTLLQQEDDFVRLGAKNLEIKADISIAKFNDALDAMPKKI
ncbi:hypothetical protein J6S88_00065 [bacterium]|nr:hypothetical protein [bacterium]